MGSEVPVGGPAGATSSGQANWLTQLLQPPEATLARPGPFSGEDEYWQLVWRALVLRHYQLEVADQADLLRTSAALQVFPEERCQQVGDDQARVLAACGLRRDELRQAWLARQSLTPSAFPAPRLLRLARRLALAERDLWVLHFLVAAALDPLFAARRGGRSTAGDLAVFLDLDGEGFSSLLDPWQPLLRHKLLEVERGLLGAPRLREVRIDLPTAKALRGLALSVDDAATLAGSVIEAVVDEEPSHEAPVPLRGAPTPRLRAPSPEAEDRGALNGEEMVREPPAGATACAADAPASEVPYVSDLDYLQDHLEAFRLRILWKKEQGEAPLFAAGDGRERAARVRELRAQELVEAKRIARRLEATERAGAWLPRGEQLARSRGLSTVEKHVLLLLTGLSASVEFRELVNSSTASVGDLLRLFFDDFRAQVAGRNLFFRDAVLVREGLVRIDAGPLDGDLLRADCLVDGRMTEYLLGLDAAGAILVEGSHLYTPAVDPGQVVLSAEDKALILQTAEAFPAFRRARHRAGLDDVLSYGRGLVMLFFGPSGTGKTMTANALATRLGKRVLLVNFPKLGDMTGDLALKFLFREARLHDAILFFDECERLFQSRDRQNTGLSLLLTELERHDGLVIMATNRPLELDEAMHRRVTLAIEFRPPDPAQREAIWRTHLPAEFPLEGEPDLRGLAREHELSGGLIKNAVLAALSIATARCPERPRVRPDDLERGARLQARGRLQAGDFGDGAVPRCGVADVVLPPTLRAQIRDLVGLERSRRVLLDEWGFSRLGGAGLGTTALFYGPPGTGKTLTAEAIAFDLGRPAKIVSPSRILSRWVGDSAKSLEAAFRDAREHGAVLVFDEADALFANRTSVASSTDRYANLDVCVLLREMERFPGVAILTTNLASNIDEAFRRRMRFVLEFPAPDASARQALWHAHLPALAPRDEDVDLERLAAAFELSGGQIRNAVLKAAARAAQRDPSARRLRQADLRAAAGEEASAAVASRPLGFMRDTQRWSRA